MRSAASLRPCWWPLPTPIAPADRYAETFARMAGTKRITAHRLRPPRQGDDWNDGLRRASSWDTGRQFGQHKARQTEAADELFRLDPTRPVTEAALSGQELGNGA